jgi:signal transduction histidine kinase
VERAEFFQHRFSRDESCAARVREWLDGLDLDLPQDAPLLTHELVTNAFRHGDGDHVWVTLIATEDRVFVEVIDEGLGDPHVVRPRPFEESGRGLLWVDNLADDWGVARHGVTHVWFRLPS